MLGLLGAGEAPYSEIELRNSDIGGIAVHAAARVMAQAEA
jgi:hypothetical protein